MKNVYPIRGTSSQDEALLDLHVQELERERMAKEWQNPRRRGKMIDAGVKIIIGAALLVLTLGGLYLLGAL